MLEIPFWGKLYNLRKLITVGLLMAIIVAICTFGIQVWIRHHKKASLIERFQNEAPQTYSFSGSVTRFVPSGDIQVDLAQIPSTYKLVYEMEFGCSVCFVHLKEINAFLQELRETKEIEFFIITHEPSIGFISFYIRDTLRDCDLWIIQQDFNKDGIKVYLLDKCNNIIQAGNVSEYPFMKKEYLNALKDK